MSKTLITSASLLNHQEEFQKCLIVRFSQNYVQFEFDIWQKHFLEIVLTTSASFFNNKI
jgi:hypothetical protein